MLQRWSIALTDLAMLGGGLWKLSVQSFTKLLCKLRITMTTVQMMQAWLVKFEGLLQTLLGSLCDTVH